MTNRPNSKMRIINTFYTSKCEVGICEYENKKYFYKHLPGSNEYENYKLVKPYFKVSQSAVKLKEYILYEYIKDFENLTINDYLYGNKIEIIDFKIIAQQYEKSLNNTLQIMNELETNSKKYFYDRLATIKQYIEQVKYENVIVNGKKYNLKHILKEIYLNIVKDKQLYSFITQGDPTDTNITVTGYFTDFETAGYNTILGEFSIIFVSLFSHGMYFYPKYNKNAYSVNKQILSKYEEYAKKILYTIKGENIHIDYFDNNLPEKNKKFILSFLNIYLNNKKYYDDFKLLKYYICMRLLTPINIMNMDKKDMFVIFTLVILIFENINTIEDILNIL